VRSQYQDQQITLNRRRGEYNMALKRQDWDAADALAASIAELEDQLELSRPASGLQTPTTAAGEDSKASSSSALGAAGGDAIWRMKERNKEVLRQALEAAKKEAAAGNADKQRKKAKLEPTSSGQQLASVLSISLTGWTFGSGFPPASLLTNLRFTPWLPLGPTRTTSTWRLPTTTSRPTAPPRAASRFQLGRRTALASAR
jgi:hypothetical protein